MDELEEVNSQQWCDLFLKKKKLCGLRLVLFAIISNFIQLNNFLNVLIFL